MDKRTYIIAAAGTGGHILPGVAIADKIKENEPGARIFFLGTKDGMENTLVRNSGYKILHIRASGMVSGSFLKKTMSLINFVSGFFQSFRILKKLNVSAVVGMGGYISGPVVLCASLLNIPAVLHEQNAYPGKSNMWLSGRCDTVCISYPDSIRYFDRAKKVVVTGNPIRNAFYGLDKKTSRKKLGIKPGAKLVFITGGSLGARSINDAVINMINNNNEFGYTIVLASGKRDYSHVCNKIMDNEVVDVKDYLFDQHLYMSAADIIVSRAGAISCSEIALLGKPSVMIPYPFAAGDHQKLNAKAFSDIGAAEIIEDRDCTGEILYNKLNELFEKPDKLEKMGDMALSLAYPNASELIYNQVKKAIEK